MTKLFISQPMRGRRMADIVRERKTLVADAAVALQEDEIAVLDTLFDDTDATPLAPAGAGAGEAGRSGRGDFCARLGNGARVPHGAPGGGRIRDQDRGGVEKMEEQNMFFVDQGGGDGAVRGVFGGLWLAGVAGAGLGCVHGDRLDQWQRGCGVQRRVVKRCGARRHLAQGRDGGCSDCSRHGRRRAGRGGGKPARIGHTIHRADFAGGAGMVHFTELGSIAENAAAMGAPVPEGLIKLFGRRKTRGGKVRAGYRY